MAIETFGASLCFGKLNGLLKGVSRHLEIVPLVLFEVLTAVYLSGFFLNKFLEKHASGEFEGHDSVVDLRVGHRYSSSRYNCINYIRD